MRVINQQTSRWGAPPFSRCRGKFLSGGERTLELRWIKLGGVTMTMMTWELDIQISWIVSSIFLYIYLISILIIHHHTRFYWDPQGEINQTRCFLCQVCGNSSWACCWFHLSSIDDQAVCFVRLLCVVTPRLQLTWPLRFCSLWFAQALVAVTAPIYIHLSFNLFFY